MKALTPWHTRREAQPGDVQPEHLYASATETEDVHLRNYLRVLIRHRQVVVLAFLIVIGIVAYVSFSATPLYIATATLKIEPQNPTVTDVRELLQLSGGAGPYDYYQTLYKLLQSRSLAAKIVADLNLKSNPPFATTPLISGNIVKRVQSWILGNFQFAVSRIQSYFEQPEKTYRDPIVAKQASENLEISNTTNNVKPWLVDRYLGFLEVTPIKNTRLVEIQFSTPDPELSRRLADAHAGGFIRMNLESRYEINNEARKFLDAKNDELKRKVERSEEALNHFRQTHGVVSMEKGENIVVDRLVDINRQLTAATGRRIEAESLYKVIENKSTYYLSQIMSHGLVPTLRANLQALEAEKVKLSTVFTPDHPRMQEQNSRLSETRLALNTEITHVVRSIQEDYMAARAKEQALAAEANQQRQAALHLKHLGVEYAVLQNEVSVNRTLYENVLKRLSETAISNDLAISNLQVMQKAERPRRPSLPNIPFNLILASAFGLFIGAGLAFFLEYMDSTVSTPEDVWRTVSLNTLGVVPNVGSLKHSPSDKRRLAKSLLLKLQGHLKRNGGQSPSKDLILSHDPLSIISEFYRIIQTTLLFSQAETPPRVVLISSAGPQEGKTVTTLNMGISLAQDGHSVLVIDADLRRGSCHHRLGLKNHKGLTHVLTGKLSLEECVQMTHISGLSLLTPGIVPPHSSRLLGSNKMREILNSLRDSYEFVLIDSPPVVAVSDAAVLSTLADGVLLVLRAGKTMGASARLAAERLEACRAWIIGVVLNGVDLRDPDYAHQRNYYYYNGQDNILSTGTRLNNGGGHIVDISLGSVAETDGSALTERPAEFMSDDFFNLMLSNLTDALGPIAPIVLRDRIAELGETEDAFPQKRLGELIELVSQEISDNALKKRFVETSADDLSCAAASQR